MVNIILMLSLIYNQDPILGDNFNNVVRNVANSYKSKNYYLTRVKKYNPIGRFQSEEESDIIGDEIYKMLLEEEIEYTWMSGTMANYDRIVFDVLKELKGEKI